MDVVCNGPFSKIEISLFQGLNYVAGILILITTSDQTSFWLLKALVENILPDYFSPSMIGVLVDIEVLAELVR